MGLRGAMAKTWTCYVINPLEPKSDRMLAQLEGGFWVPYDWSPDDRKVLVYEYISANENNLWIVDVTTGRKTLLTPKKGSERLPTGLANSARMAKASMSQTDRDSEYQRIAYIDIADRGIQTRDR